jgi:transcriptional regulator with XRE-family HTH domain
MWRRGYTQKQLAAILNVDQGSISNRLHGKTNWTAVEVSVVANWLGVPLTDIMPAVELGDPLKPDGAGGPARRRASYRVIGSEIPNMSIWDSLPVTVKRRAA